MNPFFPNPLNRPGAAPALPPWAFMPQQDQTEQLLNLMSLLNTSKASSTVDTLVAEVAKLDDLLAGGDVVTRANVLKAIVKNQLSAQQTQLKSDKINQLAPLFTGSGGGFGGMPFGGASFGGGNSMITTLLLVSMLGGSGFSLF